ncbi:hypothetical protein Q7P37_010720 [Cladosporium fusiforme]
MSEAQDAAIQMAETIQSAHIIESPSVEHDINPSTAASEKEPVRLDRSPSVDVLSDIDEDEVPISILRPAPRKPQMPPLPDLRFEQSYLASIKDAKDWKVVTYITIRDQLFMPLVQGMAWTLIVSGWRHLNRSSTLQGQSIGAKIRRWWWETNNWKIPEATGKARREL